MEAIALSQVDAEPVNRIVHHPEVEPVFFDVENPAEFEFSDDTGNIYLLAHDEGTVGVFICIPINPYLYHTHVAFLPGERARTIEAGKKAVEWMFAHTFAQNLTTFTPSDNRVALWYARHVGFRKCGTIHQGLCRNGATCDYVISEVTKWQQ